MAYGRFVGVVFPVVRAVADQVVSWEAQACRECGTRRGVPPAELRSLIARVGLQDVVFEPLVRRG